MRRQLGRVDPRRADHEPEGRGRFRAYSPGSHPKGEINPNVLRLLESLRYQTSGLRSKSREAPPGAPTLDFVFALCDDGCRRELPRLARSADDGALGYGRPRCGAGQPGRRRARVRRCRMLDNRITLFMSLPLASLDCLPLRRRVDEIGERHEAELKR